VRSPPRPLAPVLDFLLSVCGSIDMNPYSGTSTLAKVLRAAAIGGGIVYGSVKLGYFKVRRNCPGEPRTKGPEQRVVVGPFVSSGPLTGPRSSYCVLRRCNRSSLPRSAHTPYAERGFVEREEGGQRGSEALIGRIDRSIDLWVDCDRRMQAGNKIGVSVVASLRGGSGDGGKVLLAK